MLLRSHSNGHHTQSTARLPAGPRSLSAVEHSRCFDLLRSSCPSSVEAEFIVRRGIANPACFLHPALPSLTDFSAFPGVRDSLKVLTEVVRSKQPVALFGDYDVDGVCAVGIVAHVLRALGVPYVADTPCRRVEGYGANFRMVDEAALHGCGAAFLLDFGTTQHRVIERLQSRGMRVVVIDHHRQGNFSLPGAEAIINPNARGNAYQQLCAAGLCYLWARQVRESFDAPIELEPLVALAGLATVADVMRLDDSCNRALVQAGLRAYHTHPGLRALGDALGVPKSPRVSDFAFQIGPAVNAPGRIRARQGKDIELPERGALDAQDLVMPVPVVPYGITAEKLIAANKDRKKREFIDFGHARSLLTSVSGDRAITIGSDVFDPGVVGLQASRLSEQTGRPAVVVAWEGDRGKGSVRSAGEVRVYEALERCREHLRHFGGHDAAGGLVIERKAFEGFSRAFSAEVERQAGPYEQRTVEADLMMTVGQLAHGLGDVHRALANFGPYGNGNPWPSVFIPGARIRRVLPLGQEHYRVALIDGAHEIEVYLWRGSESPVPLWQGRTLDLVCRVGEYRSGNGTELEPSLEIQAARLK